MRVELGGRRQLNFENALTCNEWLGPDLPKTWKTLRELFNHDQDDNREQRLMVHRHNRALAFLFHGVEEAVGQDRIVVVGVTPKGYAASPLMILERELASTQQIFAFTISTRDYFSMSTSEDWQPQTPLVKPDKVTGQFKIDNHALEDFAFLAAEQYLSPSKLEAFAKKANWKKRTQLFARWGLQIGFNVQKLGEIGQPFSLKAKEPVLNHRQLKMTFANYE